ncbi:hypothetical protein [Halegenticoccus tardaugens]|uniref:hypothetical protein n=1 Tax=Halegenticoccus tardaugens TaxID=2071624 RepID=UPI00100B6EAB|nr:hypothetical protein [Halegenticoccus tardaugens]
MKSEDFEKKSREYTKVLETLRRLPDRKMSEHKISEELAEEEFDAGEILEGLVLLGEVELSQVRPVGGRIWLKRQETPTNTEERKVVSRSIWQGYAAKDYRDRIADRIFTTREASMVHLAESVVTSPSDFEQLSFLNDVWVADAGGRSDLTAVIRRETVYQTTNADQRLERLKNQHR